MFTVLEAPDGKTEKVAFIPEGFACGALVFSVLWALLHRMWVIALILFAVFAVLTAAANFELIDAGSALLIQCAIALVFGFEARNLQVQSLECSGYRRAGLIQATTLEAAELTYFASRSPARPEPAPARISAAHDDTLGIFGNV